MSLDKKLIEVFRIFMEKTVLPFVRTNDKITKEWSYLNSILSQDYLNVSKLDIFVMNIAPQRVSSNSSSNNKAGPISLESKNNFAKKDFFEDNRSAVMNNLTSSTNNSSDYRFSKPNNEMPQPNYLQVGIDNYRNSGLSPNKFIDLNMSKQLGKEPVVRLDDNSRRSLIMILENFHNTLMSNQQKLENELKKPVFKNGPQVTTGKDFSEQKRFY